MASQTLRLAVFDVDGTLIDSQHIIVAAMVEACGAHGIAPPEAARVRRVIGLSLVEAIATLLPDLAEEEHLRIARTYKDAFNALIQIPAHEEPMFPGALEAMTALENDGWLLGLATGKSQRGVFRLIERYSLQRRFVTLQTADDNPGKPHPAMLVRAMAEAGVDKAQTVMIGDTTFDMQMARNAGVSGIGVAWGNHEAGELRQVGACDIIESFHHLAPLCARLAAFPSLVGVGTA